MTKIILEPFKSIILPISPYEMTEVFVPLDKLQTSTDYWIKASFSGGYAIEVIMKRKSVQFDKLTHPSANSDYAKRYGGGLGLRDHRYPSHFKLNHNKKYEDDPNG